MRREEPSRRLDPVRGDKDGHTARLRHQQRLVADFTGAAVAAHFAAIGSRPSIAARDHAGRKAPRMQVLHERHHHRRLARPAGDHVAHDNDGHRDALAPDQAGAIGAAPNSGERAEDQRSRPEQAGQSAAPQPCALQRLRHGYRVPPWAEDWVAKVICIRPERRAASITVMTDWWGAAASALMMITLSLPALAASVSASATASTLRPATGTPLTEYLASLVTPTMTSLG